MTQAPEKFVGGGVLRKEDPALVTGQANWTDNIKLPGMLHATLLRSPFAHAKITSIDVSAAKEQPGVVAVFTGDDLADEYDKNPQANPAAVTGYGVSLEDRSQGGAPVTEDGQPVDEETKTFVSWIPTDDTKIPNHWPVARDEVNYAGDIVAVVVRPTATRRRTPSSSSRSITSRWRRCWTSKVPLPKGLHSCTRTSGPTRASPGRSRPET